MRQFLHIGYKGTKYHGWQRQTNVISVQEVLEAAIEKMVGYQVTILGCGRTDAGVHASQYFCHFDLKIPVDYDIVFRLNKMLPDDIVIFEQMKMDDNKHAQYDATKRTYQFLVHFKKDPYLHDLSSFYQIENPDFTKMQEAVSMIPKYSNFRTFCKSPDIYKHTNCKIFSAQLYVNEKKDRMRFEITSNRFVRGMIRLLMLRLLEIGEGRLSIDDWTKYLAAEKELPFKTFAYPQGLYLTKVLYPYLEKPSASLFYDTEGIQLNNWKAL